MNKTNTPNERFEHLGTFDLNEWPNENSLNRGTTNKFQKINYSNEKVIYCWSLFNNCIHLRSLVQSRQIFLYFYDYSHDTSTASNFQKKIPVFLVLFVIILRFPYQLLIQT